MSVWSFYLLYAICPFLARRSLVEITVVRTKQQCGATVKDGVLPIMRVRVQAQKAYFE